jgi:hypothetical protein
MSHFALIRNVTYEDLFEEVFDGRTFADEWEGAAAEIGVRPGGRGEIELGFGINAFGAFLPADAAGL